MRGIANVVVGQSVCQQKWGNHTQSVNGLRNPDNSKVTWEHIKVGRPGSDVKKKKGGADLHYRSPCRPLNAKEKHIDMGNGRCAGSGATSAPVMSAKPA